METGWKNTTKNREFIKATYGFTHHKGNRRPYFSITADIGVPNYRKGWPEDDSYTDEHFIITGGGCCHDDIVKHFPELKPLIRWHLVDDDATPMHYLANAMYWIEMHLGLSKWENDGQADPLEAFKNTIVFGAVADDQQKLDAFLAIPETDRYYPNFLGSIRNWLETSRLSTMQAAMRRDMEAYGVDYMDESAIEAINARSA